MPLPAVRLPRSELPFFFFNYFLWIDLLLALLGCSTWLSLVAESGRWCLVGGCGLVIVGTSRFVDAGLSDTWASGVAGPGPWSPALAHAEQGLEPASPALAGRVFYHRATQGASVTNIDPYITSPWVRDLKRGGFKYKALARTRGV